MFFVGYQLVEYVEISLNSLLMT